MPQWMGSSGRNNKGADTFARHCTCASKYSICSGLSPLSIRMFCFSLNHIVIHSFFLKHIHLLNFNHPFFGGGQRGKWSRKVLMRGGATPQFKHIISSCFVEAFVHFFSSAIFTIFCWTKPIFPLNYTTLFFLNFYYFSANIGNFLFK